MNGNADREWVRRRRSDRRRKPKRMSGGAGQSARKLESPMFAMSEENTVQIMAEGYLVCFDWHLPKGTVFNDFPCWDMAFIAEGI